MQVCYIPLAQWPLVSDFFTSPLVNNLYCCVATYEALPASNTDALHLGVKIFDIMAGYQAETGLDPEGGGGGGGGGGGAGGGCSPPPPPPPPNPPPPPLDRNSI